MNTVCKTAVTVILAVVMVTGCQMSRQDTATIMGAGLGSVVGYSISDHPAGAVAGGVAGGYIGNRLAD